MSVAESLPPMPLLLVEDDVPLSGCWRSSKGLCGWIGMDLYRTRI
jgi:hypothetical protein